MTDARHHQHKRKRIYEKHEPYPHPDPLKNMLDKLIYVVGIAGPLMTIPQLLKVWLEQDISGVSVLTWGGMNFISAVWLIYGVVHMEKPIIITYFLWIVFQTMIIIGVLLN